MNIPVPPDELIVRWTGYEEAAEIMRRAAEFIPVEEQVRRRPIARMGQIRIACFPALCAAAEALTIAMVAATIISIVENYTTPKNRRRRRTHLCASTASAIVEMVRQDIANGYFQNRALEYDNTEKRKQRNFKSRA